MSKKYTLTDLELPDDEPMVVIRSSFLWICDNDKYAAAVLNMYVHWTKWIMKHRPVAQGINKKLKRQGKNATQDTSLVIYRKQSKLLEDMLDFCSEKRFRAANDLLVKKGLLKIDDSGAKHFDHILKYELNIDVFKECLKAWREQRDTINEDTDSDDNFEVDSSFQEESIGTDNLPLREEPFTAPGADNLPLQERTIYRSSNIDNQIDVCRDEKKITAQSPNGDVCLPSSPSPISTHKKGRPRPTDQTSTPEQPNLKSTRKADVDPDVLEQAKSTMEREIGGRVIWESQYVRSVKEIIRSGGTCEEIQTVIRRLKADKYHKDKVTVPYVIREFPNQLSQANLTISSDEPSTQEDTPPKFDANTDPRTLSNSDHIEWVSLYGPVKDTVLV